MQQDGEHLDLLQNLEYAMIRIRREHRETTDHMAARVDEALHQRERAQARGRQGLPTLVDGFAK